MAIKQQCDQQQQQQSSRELLGQEAAMTTTFTSLRGRFLLNLNRKLNLSFFRILEGVLYFKLSGVAWPI